MNSKKLHRIIIAAVFISTIVMSALLPLNVLAQTTSPTASPTATATVTPTPKPNVVFVGTVTTGTLNARSGPGLSYPVVATFFPGELVTLTGRTSNGAWLRLDSAKFPDVWANVQFVKPSSPVETLAVVDKLSDGTKIAVTAIVNAPRLNMRQGPWVNYDVVAMANQNEVVGIIGKNAAGTWANVRLVNNKTGWANVTLLQPERAWDRIVNQLPITSVAGMEYDDVVTVGKPVTVTVDSFPQYVPITITVSSPLSNSTCQVAKSKTGYHGVKDVIFVFPKECPSGKALNGTTVSLTVTSGDPLYTITANVNVNK